MSLTMPTPFGHASASVLAAVMCGTAASTYDRRGDRVLLAPRTSEDSGFDGRGKAKGPIDDGDVVVDGLGDDGHGALELALLHLRVYFAPA